VTPRVDNGPARVLRTYFRAKDENRPHLMREVFTHDAVLRIRVDSDAISFPAETRGLGPITDVLVSDFGRTNENVYSFYLDCPPADATSFECGWLVGMSMKGTGEIRVGCGRYEWTLRPGEPLLACALAIGIECMQVLPAGEARPVFSWLTGLDGYPWATRGQVLASAPKLAQLAPVLESLQEKGPR